MKDTSRSRFLELAKQMTGIYHNELNAIMSSIKFKERLKCEANDGVETYLKGKSAENIDVMSIRLRLNHSPCVCP